MDYEKKYKKLVGKIEKAYLYAQTDSTKAVLEEIRPELKESEDERIRKEIMEYITLYKDSLDDDEYKSWLAWLEKQGGSFIQWNKNTEGNKPQVNHSILMKTTQGIAEGEWKGEYWEQYRWAGIVRDSDVLSWMELSSLEKQGEQKPTLRERYKNIAESEWFKKTHDGMSVSNDEGMIEALRTEYEKGRADVIAGTLSWLDNCWPKYCSNQTIIEGFKEAIQYE